MRNYRALITALLTLVFAVGCSKAWIDDEGNYRRAYGFDKAPYIQIVHSYYSTSRWGRKDPRYFFAQRLPEELVQKLVADGTMRSETPDSRARYGCGGKPPDWFVPKSADHYEMWVYKDFSGIRMFRDKDNGTIYNCGGRP